VIGALPNAPFASLSGGERSTTGARPTRASWAGLSRPTCGWSKRVRAVAADVDATSAQGDDIAPIPGTRRVEENPADAVVLTAHQLARLDALTPATGARHDDANMASIDR
jgi:hypothetical protein